MSLKKNVAGQSVGAQMINAETGAAFTGSVTCYVTGDAGTQAVGSVSAGACAHEGNGFHTYGPAQAETNYDHIGYTFIGTGAIPITVQVYTSFPQSDDIGTGGANLTAQPWNSAWDPEVQSEVADALAAAGVTDVANAAKTGTVQLTPTPTVNGFRGDSGLSTTPDFYNTKFLIFTSGTLQGIGEFISDYTSDRDFTFGKSLPVAPSNGDTFLISGGRP